MNPLPPNSDELVSAYLDGQAAPDEIVLIESNPGLMARVETMRSVTRMFAEGPAAAPAQKEAHIAAALGAFDEFFAVAETTAPAPPQLAAVPPAAASTAPPPPTDNTVASFEAARDKRRSRRFSPGLIAAALAAVALFVIVAAFNFGGSSSDVATSAADASSQASTTGSAEAMAAEPMEADAMDEAMADDAGDFAFEQGARIEEESADRTSGEALSELPQATAAPAEAPEVVAAAPAEDSADAAMEEEAMEEEALTESAPPDTALFFMGAFDDQPQLRDAITGIEPFELDDRLLSVKQGLFPSCQAQVDELASSDTATLLGEAQIDGQLVEIHRVIVDEEAIIVLVDPTTCVVVPSDS